MSINDTDTDSSTDSDTDSDSESFSDSINDSQSKTTCYLCGKEITVDGEERKTMCCGVSLCRSHSEEFCKLDTGQNEIVTVCKGSKLRGDATFSYWSNDSCSVIKNTKTEITEVTKKRKSTGVNKKSDDDNETGNSDNKDNNDSTKKKRTKRNHGSFSDNNNNNDDDE